MNMDSQECLRLTYKDGCFKSTEYFHIQSLTADLKACGNLIVVGRLGGQIFFFFFYLQLLIDKVHNIIKTQSTSGKLFNRY